MNRHCFSFHGNRRQRVQFPSVGSFQPVAIATHVLESSEHTGTIKVKSTLQALPATGLQRCDSHRTFPLKVPDRYKLQGVEGRRIICSVRCRRVARSARPQACRAACPESGSRSTARYNMRRNPDGTYDSLRQTEIRQSPYSS
jgi:hypothetical protein